MLCFQVMTNKNKTDWNLRKLFYTSATNSKIEEDMVRGDTATKTFATKYRKDKKWLSNPKSLAKALSEYEKLELVCSPAPILYASYRKELNASDKQAEALANTLDERYTKRGNMLMFFSLELAKISPSMQKRFLKAPELTKYRYMLKVLFESAKHDLSEPEEKILSLLGDVSNGRWIQAVEDIIHTKEVSFDGKNIPVPQALEILRTLPKTKRYALHKATMKALRDIAPMAESELNAIITRKKITDELRKFEEPFDATILGYENERDSVLSMVSAVSKAFGVSKRFYKAKALLMGEKKLTYADRVAPAGTLKKKISFDEALNIVRKAFADLHPRYAEILDRLVSNGQVDVYPKKGKSGGAFCSGAVSSPTMVLLNHVDDAHSLLTLAHEMGHAIHTERSKKQQPVYQNYTTSVAETASTFFEQVAFDALTEKLTEKERLIAMHDRLQGDIVTVFRQIACFNFESDMHQAVRSKGLIPKEDIAKLMNKHMASYLGNSVELTEDDGYFFVAWSHIRRFFYVYSYAYGQLISRAMYARVKKDHSYIEKVDAFLTAGGSASPEDIFEACGLNVRSEAFFKEGLKSIERDVLEFEKAVKNVVKKAV